jgi:hypothetical protein
VLEVTDRILTEILETEAEALEIERRALQEAKGLVQEARLHARHLIEKGVEDDERRYADAVTAMEKSGEAILSEQLLESAEAAGAMRKAARDHFDAAVALIAEEIAGAHGHS